MKAKTPIIAIVTTLAVCAACDDLPQQPADRHLETVTMKTSNQATGVTKEPIGGEIGLLGLGAPDRTVATPGGMCHLFDVPVFTEFTGDLEGTMTVHESIHQKCVGGRLVASGPFEGEITWNERTGMIAGQFTTNCDPDPSQPTGVSCDGTMIARGSGGLEGVRFHIDWGPGWYPFPYRGTAFSKE